MALRRVAVVAGEESGDILGAGLMSELKKIYPEISFVGIGGNRMLAEGLESKYPLDRLAVMGLIEPLKRLPELLKMRRQLCADFSREPVDLFIGIDAPDFNLGLAKKLKQRGIRTVHYVSPSVWAWRQGRVKSIRESIDLMLTLLPFEAQFYETHQVPVTYVGHPLALEIEAGQNAADARLKLNLQGNDRIVALLPGSRSGEIKHLMPVYLQAAKKLEQSDANLRFVFAAVNEAKAQQIRAFFNSPDEYEVLVNRTIDLMVAADLVLAASGTTTLEIMLVNRPLVVAYRTDWLSYKIIGSMVKVDYVSLPNLIAGQFLVEEYIQYRATPDNLSAAMRKLLVDEAARDTQSRAFAELRHQLELPSSRLAAEAIAKLLES